MLCYYKGLVQGVYIGYVSKCYGVIYGDPNGYLNIHPEFVASDLLKKESYSKMIIGRHYKHTVAVNHTLEGGDPGWFMWKHQIWRLF